MNSLEDTYRRAIAAIVPERDGLYFYIVMRFFFKATLKRIKIKNIETEALECYENGSWRDVKNKGLSITLAPGQYFLFRCKIKKIPKETKVQAEIKYKNWEGKGKKIIVEDTWIGGEKNITVEKKEAEYNTIDVLEIWGINEDFYISGEGDINYIKKAGKNRILIRYKDNVFRIWKARILIITKESHKTYGFSIYNYDPSNRISLFTEDMDELVDDVEHDIRSDIFKRIDEEVAIRRVNPGDLKKAIKRIIKDLETKYYPYVFGSSTVYGGTPFRYYNPHDFQHAKRVVYASFKIAELLGLLQELNIYELVIFYLAAWMHDVGMSPSGIVSGRTSYDAIRMMHSVESMIISEKILSEHTNIFNSKIIDLIKILTWAHSGRLYEVIEEMNSILKYREEIRKDINAGEDPAGSIENAWKASAESNIPEARVCGRALILLECRDIKNKEMLIEKYKELINDPWLNDAPEIENGITKLFFILFPNASIGKIASVFGVDEKKARELRNEYLKEYDVSEIESSLMPQPKKARAQEIKDVIGQYIPGDPVNYWTEHPYQIDKDRIIKLAIIIRLADMLDNTRLRRIRNPEIIGEALAFAFCGMKNYDESIAHYIARDMCKGVYLQLTVEKETILSIIFDIDVSRKIELLFKGRSRTWQYSRFLGDPKECKKPEGPSFYADIWSELSHDKSKNCKSREGVIREIMGDYGIKIEWEYNMIKGSVSIASPEIETWVNIAYRILSRYSCDFLREKYGPKPEGITLHEIEKYVDVRALNYYEIQIKFSPTFLEKIGVDSIEGIARVENESYIERVRFHRDYIIIETKEPLKTIGSSSYSIPTASITLMRITFHVALCLPVLYEDNGIVSHLYAVYSKDRICLFPKENPEVNIEFNPKDKRYRVSVNRLSTPSVELPSYREIKEKIQW